MKSYENVIALYFKSLEAFKEFERIPRKFGTGDLLYHSEIHTLQAIGSHIKINLTDLSERLNISKSGTSKFIAKLLKKNLITKSKLFNNNKEVVFALTEKGTIAYNAHEKFSKKTFESIYNLLSHLEDDQIEFLESFLVDLVLCAEKLNNKDLN
ncbi:MAG: winged helix-turn-helix transcriptional regulator [Tenericutes bacterium]|nr:winged helix-turn-helix transcriptional regulator [Mycoplasmatota bacterium]